MEGSTGEKKSKKSRQRRRRVSDCESDLLELYAENNLSPLCTTATDYGHTNKRPSYSKEQMLEPGKRPTHFIAIRITDATIVASLRNIQKMLIERETLLTKGAFHPDMFHITLCTLGLDSEQDVAHCVTVLKEMQQYFAENLPQTPLTLYSLSQFYNRAIYAKVQHKEDFLQFSSLLRTKLQDSKVEIRDEHEGFNPHVTIIKVKRPERRAFGTRNIHSSIYSDFLEVTHGHQKMDAIYLCSMDGQRRSDGFYTTLCDIHFM